MSLWDGLARATADALAATLSGEQRQRGTALIVARSAKPDADASDLMILANYVVTGFEIIPEPKDDPYPYPSGDTTVLGPQVISSTTGPAENTVLNWRGENFVPQRLPDLGDLQTRSDMDEGFEDEYPDDPGPEESSGEIPDLANEPAPMAGAHWQGRRGSRPG